MTGYAVKPSLQIRRDDRDWVVRRPVIDVATQTPDQAVSVPDAVCFQISEERGDSYLEGFIPALLARDDLGGYFHPTHGVGAPQRAVPGARA